MSIIFIVLIAFLICGFIGAGLAGEKGRGVAGFWLGFLFGPIGIVIALLLSPSTPITESTVPDLKPCPFCAEPIRTAAIKCRYCHSDLPESSQSHVEAVPPAPSVAISIAAPAVVMGQVDQGEETTSNTLRTLGVVATLLITGSIVVAATQYSNRSAVPLPLTPSPGPASSASIPASSSTPLVYPAQDDPRAKAILRACIDGKPFALEHGKWVPNNIVIGDAPVSCVIEK